MSLCRHEALTWPTVICGLDFAASQCAWFQWDCSRWRIKHKHYVHFPDTSTRNRLYPQGQAPHEYSQIMHISWLVFIFLIPTEPTCNLSFSSFLVQKPNTKRGPVWSREWPSPCFTLEQRMWASYKQTRVPLPRHKARIASHGKQSKKRLKTTQGSQKINWPLYITTAFILAFPGRLRTLIQWGILFPWLGVTLTLASSISAAILTGSISLSP